MVEAALQSLEVRYLKDSDGDLMIQFGYDPDIDCSSDAWLSAEGEDNNIFALRIQTDKRFTRNDIGRLLLICNTWNVDNRWPRAQVLFGDDNPSIFVRLDYHVPLRAGVHQVLVADLVRLMAFGGYYFWKWARSEHGI